MNKNKFEEQKYDNLEVHATTRIEEKEKYFSEYGTPNEAINNVRKFFYQDQGTIEISNDYVDSQRLIVSEKCLMCKKREKKVFSIYCSNCGCSLKEFINVNEG